MVSVLLVAGCGSDESSSTAADRGGAAGQPALAEPGTPLTGGDPRAPGATGPSSTQGRAQPPGTVARTGSLSVAVDDVVESADQAGRIARDAGGTVESEQRDDDGDRARSSLRLRVPPEAFDATVAALSRLGEERSRQLGSEDVGDQVVDLDSRLASQRASVERVRALLAQAKDLGEVVRVEAELTRRTADLESLEARLSALTARIELSSIELRLVGQGSPAASTSAPGFRDGLDAGWQVVLGLGRAISVAAGVLVPFSPLLAVGGLVLWRSRARRPRVPTPPAGAAA